MILRATVDFPGQALANIWGYAQNGREYALVGSSIGVNIVDITNPDIPQKIVFIPGPHDTRREIKTYGHLAYVTNQCCKGLQIIDLSALPSPDLDAYFYTMEGMPNTSHTLHIDTTRGFLYTYGASNPLGGATIFDLKPDPYHPVYAGVFSELGYIHDGYVDNDTLYACHIYSGELAVVDMHDKTQPQVLGTIETPSRFTHSSWLLDDRKHVLTIDERYPSFLTAYDVSDPTDIREKDRFSTSRSGKSSVAHNTHVLNDWAITSWYIDGVVIVDAHRPENLVQVARYDTYDFSGLYDGCWGVYPTPLLKNIIASNISTAPQGGVGRMYILTPQYKRACYLEGQVTNSATGFPLKGVTVIIESEDPLNTTETLNDGSYKTGQATAGTFTVQIRKAGFFPQSKTVVLNPGQITVLDIQLQPLVEFPMTVEVWDAVTNQPLVAQQVVIGSALGVQTVVTDLRGRFQINCASDTTYHTTNSWGYLPASFTLNQNGFTRLYLQPGYYDDFGSDLGWTSPGNLLDYNWTRAIPAENGDELGRSPDTDMDTDDNQTCYLTGLGLYNFVYEGSVTLSSPPMRLSTYQKASLSFGYWLRNGSSAYSAEDLLRVTVTNGRENTEIFSDHTGPGTWTYQDGIELSDFIALTDSVQIHFTAQESGPTNAVEAAIDLFKVVPFHPLVNANPGSVQALPNPFSSTFSIWYNWPGVSEITLDIYNAIGQLVWTERLQEPSGNITGGATLAKGMYFAVLKSETNRSTPLKMVKH